MKKHVPLLTPLKWIILLNFVMFNLSNYAQDTGYKTPEIASIHSPNATDLGKYGDVPVSLYTGTVDVSVPIYEVNEGGIPLKIDLNYDTSGVRVNSVPGWVGQNWSLNAGGVITRVVRGNSADEHDVSRGQSQQYLENQMSVQQQYLSRVLNWDKGISNNVPRPVLNQGYKNASFVLTTLDWSSTQNLEQIRNGSQNGWLINNPYPTWLQGQKAFLPDLEPDFFTFNFMGHTGKFFLGQDGEWKVSSSSNLKVICNLPDNLISILSVPYMSDGGNNTEWQRDFPRIINNITIMDDQGNRFEFGLDNSREITFPEFFNQKRTPAVSTAWFLQSVYDKFGNQLYKFEYEKGPYIGHFYLNWGSVVMKYPGQTFPETNDQGQTVWSSSWDSSAIKGAGQLIQPVYLKKITTKSGLNLEFNSSITNAMKFKADDNTIFQTNQFYNNFLLNYTFFYDWDFFIEKLGDYTTMNPEMGNLGSNSDALCLSMLKWKKLDNIVIKDANSVVLTNVNLDYTNIPTRRLFLNAVTVNSDKKYSFEYYNDNLLPNFMSSATDHFGYYNGTPFRYTASPLALPFWRTFYNQRNSNAEYVKYGSLKKITYPTKGYTQFEFEPHTYSKEVDKSGILQAVTSDIVIGGLRIRQIINNDGLGNNYVKEYQYTNTLSATRSSGNLLYKPIYLAENISTPYTTSKWNEININPFMPFVNFTGNTIEYETVIEKQGFFSSSYGTAVNINGYTINKFSSYSQFPDYAPLNSLVPNYNFNCPRTDRGFERGKLTEKSVYDIANNLKTRNTYQYQSNQNLRVNAIKRNLVPKGSLISEDEESAYQIFYTDKYMIEDKEEVFNATGIVTKTKKYSYKRYPGETGIMNDGDIFADTSYEQGPTGGILTTFKYPFDYSDAISQHMIGTRILPSVYQKQELVTGDPYDPDTTTLLSELRTNYKEISGGFGDLIQVPDNILFKKGNETFETRFKYLQYDYKGSLLEYKTENGASNCIIWDYTGLRPLVKIENMDYSSIPVSLITAIQNASTSTGTETNLLTALNNLRNNAALASAMVTTITYKPSGSISTITDPRGYTSYYTYDQFDRLITVKDMNGNIISQNTYHFKP